ncbi:hypothetical protein IID26_00120 [Patescibacteria group bacterium]|nr:hypothetical protein [Patescibacteria group bacterium]
MQKNTVLIVSHSLDAHAKYVQERMNQRGVDHVTLDIGGYPNGFESSYLVGQNGPDRRFLTSAANFSVENVKSVWWRRPRGKYRAEPYDMKERYILEETEAYVRSFPHLLNGVRWVSEPEATRISGRKPYQLHVAQRIGWRIPETCVGNSRKAALAFLEHLSGKPMIVKPVCSSFVRLNPAKEDKERLNRVIYTRRVSQKVIKAHLDSIPLCPFILQEEVKKEFDVRVTVVGKKVFAVKIVGESLYGYNHGVDWRHHNYRRIYSEHILPTKIAALCRDITFSLGLVFGCIDLGYSERDGYTFFEINPQGQWLPSELEVGLPISQALIDLLHG